MKSETRNCQNCKKDFVIEPDDFSFYEKIKVPSEIQKIVAERDKVRKEKNWIKSDELRDEIIKMGYVLDDTVEGTRVKKK